MNKHANEILFDCNVNSDALKQGLVILNCVARNTSNQSVSFLPWNTPLESRLRGRFLEIIVNDGDTLSYRGIMVKRAAPTEDDYLILKPGDSANNSLDLTQSYTFCADSNYRINYSGYQTNTDQDTVMLSMPSVDFSIGSAFSSCEPTS